LPSAIVVGVGSLLFGAFDVARRDSRPAVWGIIGLGLAAIVFGTYFLLSLLGYRTGSDGTVKVPRASAWLVVLAVVVAVGAVAYLVLRGLPETWR